MTATPPPVVNDRTYVFTPSLVVTVQPFSVVVAGGVVVSDVDSDVDGDLDEGFGSADADRLRDGAGFVVRVGSAVAGDGAAVVSETAAGAGS